MKRPIPTVSVAVAAIHTEAAEEEVMAAAMVVAMVEVAEATAEEAEVAEWAAAAGQILAHPPCLEPNLKAYECNDTQPSAPQPRQRARTHTPPCPGAARSSPCGTWR